MSGSKRVIVDIPWNGIFAYRVGDVISAEAVAENGWQEFVAGESTKSAQRAVAEATGETTEES